MYVYCRNGIYANRDTEFYNLNLEIYKSIRIISFYLTKFISICIVLSSRNLNMLNKYLGKSDKMLNKTIVILLALLSIMSVTSCNKKPKLDSDIDVSSIDTNSSENMSSDLAIGEVIVFDEKELVEDLNYKLLNIMNERNYFSDSDGLLHKIGEYSYRAYQDSKFSNYIYVINPDERRPSIYDFIQSGDTLKYVGRDITDYFTVVENEK